MRRRRKNESGFALLLIFLMAAILALSMYREIPRVAFETQRQKEQLLIERGEQYKRAIQLFVKETKRYPARIEELESTNNKHFLRKRYTDPMTGKDEWRPIHAVNGVLTDSKVKKQGQEGQQKQGPTSSYIGEVAGLGQQLTNQGPSAVNPGMRRRGSDMLGPGMVATPDMPSQGVPQPPPSGIDPGTGQPVATGPTGVPGATGFPGAAGMTGQPGMAGVAPVPGAFPGQPTGFQPTTGFPGQTGAMRPGMPGQPVYPGVPVAGMPGVTGTTGMPGMTGYPGMPGGTGRMGMPGNTGGSAQSSGSSYLGSGTTYLGGGSSVGGQPSGPTVMPGMPQMPSGGNFPPGIPVNSQMGGVSPTYPTAPGSNGPAPTYPQPGGAINPQAQNAAAAMIGQILTQPRPGGMPQANTAGMGIMGTGIAGFASTADQDSIMVYNDQTNYGLWEFIFDPTKQKPLANPAGGAVGTPASQLASPGGTPIGQPMTSPFGGQPQPIAPVPGAMPGQPPVGPVGAQPIIK
jgi:hypothetical protein